MMLFHCVFFIPEGQTCPLVAGSVGPYGAFLLDGSEYTGDYAQKMSVEVSVHQLLDWLYLKSL